MAPWPRAEITSNTWNDWVIRHSYMVVPMQALVGEFVATFKEFPPRQKPSSFSVDQIMETLQSRKVADNLVPLADVPIEPVDRFKM